MKSVLSIVLKLFLHGIKNLNTINFMKGFEKLCENSAYLGSVKLSYFKKWIETLYYYKQFFIAHLFIFCINILLMFFVKVFQMTSNRQRNVC